MIRLEPMATAEFDEFFERSVAGYAESHVRAGLLPAATAPAVSRKEHERLLPQRLATPDQYLRTIVESASGRRVGEVWYARRGDGGATQVWIYWIGIDPAHRRKGYGTAALRAVEEEGRRLGSDRVGLHVFAVNSGARALYERAGYEATNIVMWKRVRP